MVRFPISHSKWVTAVALLALGCGPGDEGLEQGDEGGEGRQLAVLESALTGPVTRRLRSLRYDACVGSDLTLRGCTRSTQQLRVSPLGTEDGKQVVRLRFEDSGRCLTARATKSGDLTVYGLYMSSCEDIPEQRWRSSCSDITDATDCSYRAEPRLVKSTCSPYFGCVIENTGKTVAAYLCSRKTNDTENAFAINPASCEGERRLWRLHP